MNVGIGNEAANHIFIRIFLNISKLSSAMQYCKFKYSNRAERGAVYFGIQI
jgi:hypothetical protein